MTRLLPMLVELVVLGLLVGGVVLVYLGVRAYSPPAALIVLGCALVWAARQMPAQSERKAEPPGGGAR
jgi:4-hydroxybenzoate polyprenyltransferase